MQRRTFVLGLGVLFALAIGLRVIWLRADPPPAAAVGIVWHDEGAWTHNARNRALWGVWRTDEWNPVFVAPVFTALEYGAFRAFGVGTWQARTVPVASGLVALACLIAGTAVLAGRRAALAAGLLLATNYVFVMWNRTAMMETTMTACIVGAWAAAALAERRAGWGMAAGALATLAWFTKAAAAFFVAALVLNALMELLPRVRTDPAAAHRRRAAWWTIAGLMSMAAAIGLLFVLPHWTEYRFYNWEMSVTRKPEYSLRALVDRASWLPLAHDVFSRSWLLVAGGFAGLFSIVIRWPGARPVERLLVLWVVIGLAELVVHDSGNARRYVMFLPAFAALTGLAFADARARVEHVPPSRVPSWLVLPLFALAAYIVTGSLLRPGLQQAVESGDYRVAVRVSAAVALAVTAVAFLRWSSLTRWLAAARASRSLLVVLVSLAAAWDLTEFRAFARTRAERNYDASVALGRLLPPGTLVQGKLANGMALENAIRPIFIGNGFGNYRDRLHRDDIRFVLTYDLPRLGYESSDGSGLIEGLLAHYPNRAVVATFNVDETPMDDRAVLVDKFGDGAAAPVAPPH